jgi:branched-chain amino acid transport system permease protein
MKSQYRWLLAIGLPVAALFAAGPSLLTRDLVTALFFMFIFVTLAANYDVLGGFLGYVNLGQGAFFGLAGYTTFILIVKVTAIEQLDPVLIRPVAVLASVLVTIGFAWIFSYPLFRLQGAYFAIGTFGLVMLLSQLALNLPSVTGGAHGLYIPKPLYLSLNAVYYFGLILMAGSLALNGILHQTKMGLALKAIRESELSAAATGIHIFKYKRRALVLSSIPSGLAGCIFVLYAGYIDPDTVLGHDKTLLPVVVAMLGGSGQLFGPIVGGVIFRGIDVALKNYLLLPIPALGIYGLILMGLGLFMPKGILNRVSKKHKEQS